MMIDMPTMLVTSASMAVDAMTVNATNGLEEKDIRVPKMLLISFLFGLFQFGMPVIAYFIGHSFQSYVEPYIPWIGFGLLSFLGLKSLFDWIKEFRARKKGGQETQEEKKIGVGKMFVEAIATSIDALCIGFAYLYLPIGDAMLFFGIIGIVTFVFSFLSIFFSKYLARFLQSWAGLIASIVFFAVGLKILLEGLLG